MARINIGVLPWRIFTPKMAALILATIAVVLFAQPGLSRPDQSGGVNFEQLIKEFQTSLEKTVADVKKNLNIPENPDGASIVKAIHDQSDKADKAFKDLKTKLEETVKKNPEITGAIDKLKAKLDEASQNLKKDNPEVHANAQKAADNLKNAYESVGKEFEKINAEINKKGGIKDDFEKLFQKIFDDVKKFAENQKS